MLVIILIARHSIGKTFDSSKQKNKLITLIATLLCWQIYMYALSLTNVLENLAFPPRFVLLMILPAFAFSGIFIFKNRNRQWIQQIPAHWLIFYQVFRVLIETIFVYSVAAQVLHPNVTIEGYNYDMVFACTAPVIGFLLMNNKEKFRRLAIIWNFIGLGVIAVIIFLFQASIYFPQIFGPDMIPFPIAFTKYPYFLVAGFLMPSAVFMHLLSIVQLTRKPALVK